MTPRSANLLLIAARVPIPGTTKTRLGAVIGMARAATLYRAFLADLAAKVTPPAGETAGYDLGWTYTPADHDFRVTLTEVCGNAPAHVRYVPQHGDDWGERQNNLLRWGYDHGYERTVLIASDSPQLPASLPAEAFAVLTDHDVAMGRVHDGGYYLIGFRGFHEVLSSVPQSTPGAADALQERVASLGLRLAELPPTFDVDEVTDLDLLRAALAPSGAAAPQTWAALAALGMSGP